MKRIVCISLAVAVLLLAAGPLAGTALAGHSHSSFYFGVSSPVWGPGWGPGWGGWDPWWGPGWGWRGPGWGASYPYYSPYYSSPTIVIRQSPTTFIQRTPEPAQEYYWYYCRNPEGYYPYVKQCPDGWMKVVPSAPADGEE
jgi:hypothetical protein